LDNFYGKPPIKTKAVTETRDVSKIDLVAIYGDEVKPYIEKGKKVVDVFISILKFQYF
jgi:hypothetical protein